MTGEWSPVRVVTSLVGDARGLRDKGWVLLYFASRRHVAGHRPLKWLAPRPRSLSWRSSDSPLSVSVESGGLSSWYEIAHRGAYAPTEAFRPRPGWVVVDVGANIGAYSAWAAARLNGSGSLVAIEPNPVSFGRLTTTLGLLAVESSALQVACGDADTEVALHFEPGFTVSSSIRSFANASEHIRVHMRTLDDIVRELGIEHVDILKIDVEGAEELVLRGARQSLRNTDRVILETTSDIRPTIDRIMEDSGFTMVGEKPDHWGVVGLSLVAYGRGESARGSATPTQ